MTSRDFCYWLQGVFEVTDPTTLDAKQVSLIKRHLNMVFIHEIDPSFPENQQAALSEAHTPPFPEVSGTAHPVPVARDENTRVYIKC
jgi:hypothetical protein